MHPRPMLQAARGGFGRRADDRAFFASALSAIAVRLLLHDPVTGQEARLGVERHRFGSRAADTRDLGRARRSSTPGYQIQSGEDARCGDRRRRDGGRCLRNLAARVLRCYVNAAVPTARSMAPSRRCRCSCCGSLPWWVNGDGVGAVIIGAMPPIGGSLRDGHGLRPAGQKLALGGSWSIGPPGGRLRAIGVRSYRPMRSATRGRGAAGPGSCQCWRSCRRAQYVVDVTERGFRWLLTQSRRGRAFIDLVHRFGLGRWAGGDGTASNTPLGARVCRQASSWLRNPKASVLERVLGRTAGHRRGRLKSKNGPTDGGAATGSPNGRGLTGGPRGTLTAPAISRLAVIYRPLTIFQEPSGSWHAVPWAF